MIRLLCVGLAGMGRSDRRNAVASGRFQPVAGVDVTDDARREFEQETGAPTFASLREALETVDADAALIATPDGFHAPYSIQALQAGLDVICEKPMATRMADARRMIRTAEENERMLMIHHQLRWYPNYALTRQLVDKGRVGALRQVEFEIRVRSKAAMRGYRAELDYYILRDLSIHHFDLMRHIAGTDCASIYARSWPSPERGADISTGTAAYAVVEMDGPVTVSYRADGRSIAPRTGYLCDYRVTGSKGLITFKDGELSLQTFADFDKERPPRVFTEEEQKRAARKTCFEAFADSMKTRKPCWTDARENIKSLAMLFAAIKSARTGRVVRPRTD